MAPHQNLTSLSQWSEICETAHHTSVKYQNWFLGWRFIWLASAVVVRDNPSILLAFYQNTKLAGQSEVLFPLRIQTWQEQPWSSYTCSKCQTSQNGWQCLPPHPRYLSFRCSIFGFLKYRYSSILYFSCKILIIMNLRELT